MTEAVSSSHRSGQRLARAAAGAFLWNAGFTLAKDALQFGAMLVLVRFVSPQDYGRAALAQSVLGVIAVASTRTFMPHVLQSREPGAIDWQAQFTGGMAINVMAFVLTLLVSGLLFQIDGYSGAALPLAILASVFLVDAPANLRLLKIQVEHDWPRLMGLNGMGTLLAAVFSIVIALSGGGVWALVATVLVCSMPAVVDLFVVQGWLPDWSWSWARYRETIRFGVIRMGSAGLQAARQAIETLLVSGIYDFATLGVFTRGVGLATLAAGRIGPVLVSSLYPVITRAERRSDRFRRIAALVLCGVAYATVPAAAFLALAASDAVALLYGPKWDGVTPLLPAASACICFSGLSATAYGLLLANEEPGACLAIDTGSMISAAALAIWAVPAGTQYYLMALVGHGAVVMTITFAALHATGGIGLSAFGAAFAPSIAASVAASAATLGARSALPAIDAPALRLAIEGLVFASAFMLALRTAFPHRLRDVLEVAPGGRRLGRIMRLPMALCEK